MDDESVIRVRSSVSRVCVHLSCNPILILVSAPYCCCTLLLHCTAVRCMGSSLSVHHNGRLQKTADRHAAAAAVALLLRPDTAVASTLHTLHQSTLPITSSSPVLPPA